MIGTDWYPSALSRTTPKFIKPSLTFINSRGNQVQAKEKSKLYFDKNTTKWIFKEGQEARIKHDIRTHKFHVYYKKSLSIVEVHNKSIILELPDGT